MFISKDEADKRRGDSRNLFSPNYIPPARSVASDKSSPASEDVEDTGTEERTDPGSVPSSEADVDDSDESCGTAQASLGNADLDAILNKAVDPYSVRRRSKILRGQTDVQVAIGTSAMLLGDEKAGKLYGLSDSQALAYRGGLSSTSDITDGRAPDETRRMRLSAAKEALAEAAASRLNRSLESLTDEKIDGCSAPKLSAIAKDMATVMDRVTRDNSMPESIHFHIFKPEMKTVRDYTTVQVSSPVSGREAAKPQEGGGAE